MLDLDHDAVGLVGRGRVIKGRHWNSAQALIAPAPLWAQAEKVCDRWAQLK